MQPQRGSQCIWTGIRNMEFHTLNKTPLILNHYNVYSNHFSNLDYWDHGYVTPWEHDACAGRH